MQAYSLNGTIHIEMDDDEFLELHEELLCCKDNGPYMDALFGALCGVNA